jgi:PqqD family protein of HPr-rel-A system
VNAAGDGARVTRREDVILTRTGDEALLVDEANGNVHVVNRSAARLWELCSGDPTVEELVEAMAGAYSVEAGSIRGDVEKMVGTLQDLGLLELAS